VNAFNKIDFSVTVTLIFERMCFQMYANKQMWSKQCSSKSCCQQSAEQCSSLVCGSPHESKPRHLPLRLFT